MGMHSPTRASDPEGITIDRKIPLWSVLTAAGAVFGQGLLLWNGQNLQAVEIRHQSEQIREMAAQVKAMAAQLAIKDGIDIKQDFRIDELERRVLVIEEQRGRKQ